MTDSYPTPVAQAARSLGVHRTTLTVAVRSGLCMGEERGGYWYTSDEAAARWYAEHYRLRRDLYSRVAGKTWDQEEVGILARLVAEGRPLAEVARKLGRGEPAVRVKLAKLRALGALPTSRETRADRAKAREIAAARETLAAAGLPLEAAETGRREAHREGRLRLHIHPAVKVALGRAAAAAGVSLAQYLTWAGLAAAADPSILERGKREARDFSRG